LGECTPGDLAVIALRKKHSHAAAIQHAGLSSPSVYYTLQVCIGVLAVQYFTEQSHESGQEHRFQVTIRMVELSGYQ